jgi:hypothetical protein
VLELHVEEAGVCAVRVTVSGLGFFFFSLLTVFFRKNQSCDYCRSRKIRCAETREGSKRKRDRVEDGGSEKKRPKGKGKAREVDDEGEAEWRKRMELRMAEMETRLMARLDRGFKSLSRRLLALEQLADQDWEELVGKPDPVESEEGSESDTEMGEGDGEDTRDEEMVAEVLAEDAAEDVAEGRMEE